MSKDLTLFVAGSLATATLLLIVFFAHETSPQLLGNSSNLTPNFTVGSSTSFSLTTSSQQLLSTTTTGVGRRVAALIQPTNCTVATAGVFLNVEGSGAVATAGNGVVVTASSSLALLPYPGSPIVTTNAVQGITAGGTCNVLVTEWLSQ
jgi:hypothetical protein